MDKYQKLKEDGIAHGMCEKFQNEWVEPTAAELCRMFFRGSDFCIEHDWPSMEMARKFFSIEELTANGIYIEDGTSEGQSNVAVLDNAEVHIYVAPFKICDVYARHNSKVHLHLSTGSFCYISVLDNAEVHVDEKMGGARLKASYYSGSIVEPDMFDTIHDKNKEE